MVESPVGVCGSPIFEVIDQEMCLAEVEGELGDFTIVVQLILRPTTTKHHNKQFVTQGFLLPLVLRKMQLEDPHTTT